MKLRELIKELQKQSDELGNDGVDVDVRFCPPLRFEGSPMDISEVRNDSEILILAEMYGEPTVTIVARPYTN